MIETANKRKSRSEFRCGFLFEEQGGFKGGSPVSSSVVVRPSVSPKPESSESPKTRQAGGIWPGVFFRGALWGGKKKFRVSRSFTESIPWHQCLEATGATSKPYNVGAKGIL